MYEFFQDKKNFYIVSELCTGGELFDKIVENKYFNEEVAANIMIQILSAVKYMHANNVCHRLFIQKIFFHFFLNLLRDLKPENLLLESIRKDCPLKIIDFGSSTSFVPNALMKQKIGTVFL